MNRWGALVIAFVLAPAIARADGDGIGSRQVGTDERARVIAPPKIVTFVEAPYPEAEKAAGKQATVTLQIGITETGKVGAVVVLESAGPAFDQAALEAAKQFVFTPASVNGQPVAVKITYRYAFTIKEELHKKTTADFAGKVVDRATKKPLANVTVSLDTGQSATTGADGKFAINDVPPGDHAVTLTGDKLTPIGTQETFEASKKVEATYDLAVKTETPSDDDSDIEVVVTAPRIGKQVVSTEITAQQATKVPGTQGDVLKVVESMPGVARPAVGSGAIVVWGAAPEDTGVYVDGVRVPRLYHDGGYRSVVHGDLVKSVELVPGGYGASYGRGLGGLINVALRPLDDEKFHGSIAADVIDASAAVRGPISDKVHFAAAVRKGYLQEVANAVVTPEVASIVPLPNFWDSQARIQYDFSKKETLEAGGLVSFDHTDQNLFDADPTKNKTQSRQLVFGRAWLRYTKVTGKNDLITVLPYYGRNDQSLVQHFGATPTDVMTGTDVFGFRASYRTHPTTWLSVSVGVDAEMSSSDVSRDGSVTSPPREGDPFVFGQAPSSHINADRWSATIGSIAPYLEADAAFFDEKLHVIPGIRLEPYVISVSKVVPTEGTAPPVGAFQEDTAVDPRIALRWDATTRVTLKAAFGIYHQAPTPEDLSAVFGNPQLTTSFARHTLAGAAFKFTKTTTFEVTGFYNVMDDLVARNTSPAPALAEALLQDGSGRAYGVQMMLRQEQLGPFFGWISYSISRSERQDAPGLPYRLFDYDQTHTLTAVASLDLGKGWEIGARFRFSSGFPRTPVVAGYLDAQAGWQPVFGAKNTIRIPAFAQLDARVAKQFKIGKTEAEVYLDVQNATNTANPEEIVYNFNYTKKSYITGIPILPVLGAKWSF
jgi:TonB family protein